MNTVDNHMVTGPDYEEPAAINTELSEDELRQREADDRADVLNGVLANIGRVYDVAYLRGWTGGTKAAIELIKETPQAKVQAE